MNCPICNFNIQNDNNRIWFCPHCGSILDDEFRTEVNTEFDKSNKPVKCFRVEKSKIKKFSLVGITPIVHHLIKEKTLSKAQKEEFVLIPILSILLSVVIGILTNILVGIVVFVPLIVAFTVWMTMTINWQMKTTPEEVKIIPILFYANDNIFGWVSVDSSDFASATRPQINRVEVNKCNVLTFDYEPDKLSYAIQIRQKENVNANIVYMPDIFEIDCYKWM